MSGAATCAARRAEGVFPSPEGSRSATYTYAADGIDRDQIAISDAWPHCLIAHGQYNPK